MIKFMHNNSSGGMFTRSHAPRSPTRQPTRSTFFNKIKRKIIINNRGGRENAALIIRSDDCKIISNNETEY